MNTLSEELLINVRFTLPGRFSTTFSCRGNRLHWMASRSIPLMMHKKDGRRIIVKFQKKICVPGEISQEGLMNSSCNPNICCGIMQNANIYGVR